jgi:hypothetical protein
MTLRGIGRGFECRDSIQPAVIAKRASVQPGQTPQPAYREDKSSTRYGSAEPAIVRYFGNCLRERVAISVFGPVAEGVTDGEPHRARNVEIIHQVTEGVPEAGGLEIDETAVTVSVDEVIVDTRIAVGESEERGRVGELGNNVGQLMHCRRRHRSASVSHTLSSRGPVSEKTLDVGPAIYWSEPAPAGVVSVGLTNRDRVQVPQRPRETDQQSSGAFRALAQQDLPQRLPGGQVFEYEDAAVRVRPCGVSGQQPRCESRIELGDELQCGLFSVQLCWVPAGVMRVVSQALHHHAGRHVRRLCGQVATQDEPRLQPVNSTYADGSPVRGRDESFNPCAIRC